MSTMSVQERYPRCWLCRTALRSSGGVTSTALGYECASCTTNLTTPLTRAERAAYEAFHARADAQRTLAVGSSDAGTETEGDDR